MPHPLRNSDPSLIHLITLRTIDAALWTAPSREINGIIGGVLARYQEILGIVIYCYAFLGNHYHILVKAPRSNLDEFEENVNREIARRLNRHFSRRGKFWSERYNDRIVLTETDALAAFLYVIANPVKHGLVDHPRDWPGLCSYQQVLSERPLSFEFTHYSKRDGRNNPIRTTHQLHLSPLPQFEGLSSRDRRAALLRLVNARIQIFRDERKARNQAFLGRASVELQKAGTIPKHVTHSRRPRCFGSSDEERRAFLTSERVRYERFREASHRFRLGDLLTVFPSFCFRPPLHRTPRSEPFKPIQKMAA